MDFAPAAGAALKVIDAIEKTMPGSRPKSGDEGRRPQSAFANQAVHHGVIGWMRWHGAVLPDLEDLRLVVEKSGNSC
jgi:hypothetical protein